MQGKRKCFLTAVGDEDAVGGNGAATQVHPPRQLLLQFGQTGRESVVGSAFAIMPHGFSEAALEGSHRHERFVRHCCPQLHETGAAGGLRELQHQFLPRHWRGLEGGLRRCRQFGFVPGAQANVITGTRAGFNQAEVLELALRLHYGGNTHAELLAEAAYTGQARALRVDAVVDVGGEFVGNIVVEGHAVQFPSAG